MTSGTLVLTPSLLCLGAGEPYKPYMQVRRIIDDCSRHVTPLTAEWGCGLRTLIASFMTPRLRSILDRGPNFSKGSINTKQRPFQQKHERD